MAEENKALSSKEEIEQLKGQLELHKSLIDHIVLVLRENKIQTRTDIPTTDELLASLNEEEN